MSQVFFLPLPSGSRAGRVKLSILLRLPLLPAPAVRRFASFAFDHLLLLAMGASSSRSSSQAALAPSLLRSPFAIQSVLIIIGGHQRQALTPICQSVASPR